MEDTKQVLETLLKIVELKTGTFRKAIFDPKRKRESVLARCIYVNLLSMYTNLSEEDMAKKINKHRTNIYHMYKLHSDLMSVDKGYIKLFEDCSNEYVAMVCTDKYILTDAAIIMDRLRKAELEIMQLKEILTLKLSEKPNDELVAS